MTVKFHALPLAVFYALKGRSTIYQEAQLSQRDRAMLHVIEDLAKSLKITQGHSK